MGRSKLKSYRLNFEDKQYSFKILYRYTESSSALLDMASLKGTLLFLFGSRGCNQNGFASEDCSKEMAPACALLGVCLE